MAWVTPMETSQAEGWARGLLIAGAGTMTAAWLAIPLALLSPAAAVPALLPGPLDELLVVGAALVSWRLSVAPIGERWARLLFVVSTLLAILVAVWALDARSWLPLDPRWLLAAVHAPPRTTHAMLSTAVAALVLWWVGGRIGAGDLAGRAIVSVFGVGLAGLFGSLIVGSLAGGMGPLTGAAGTATAVFFAAALCALPLAQLVRAPSRRRADGASLPAIDPHWVLLAGGAALAVLALALLLSSAVSVALLASLATVSARLYDLVIALLTPLILAAGYLVQALLWLARGLRGRSTRAQPVKPPAPIPPPSAAHHGATAPPLLTMALTAVVVVAIALVVLLILSRTISRFGQPRREPSFEEERASVWSRDEARAGWRALLGALSARLRRPMRRRDDDEQGAPRTIRAAYRRLLRRGATLGLPRGVAETPQEYLARLRHRPIPAERDAALLTAAYMRARYGDSAAQPDDVEQALRAWARLDRLLGDGAPQQDVSRQHGSEHGS